jgi:peptide/nickel transport system permease protein
MKEAISLIWSLAAGKVSLTMIALLVLFSLLVPFVFPADFGPRVWNNPHYWVDYPQAVPPAWVPGKIKHEVFTSKEPEVLPANSGKTYLYRFSVQRSSKNLPLFVSFSVSDIVFYQDPPVIEVYAQEENKEFLLYRKMVSPLRGVQKPPFSRYREEPLREQLGIEHLSGDLEVRIHLADFQDEVGEVKLVLGGKAYGLLGTDNLGRDLIQGIWFALPIVLFLLALPVASATTVIGGILAAVSGYYGGKVDTFLQRLADLEIAVPTFVILILLIFAYGSQFYLLVLFLIVFGWPTIVIWLRPWVLQIRREGYIEAARERGLSNKRIIFFHILPVLYPALFARFIMVIVSVILIEAGLSFLGLGDPSLPTWGQILEQANQTGAIYLGYWWWLISPIAMISVVGGVFGLLWGALEPLAEPRLRRQ